MQDPNYELTPEKESKTRSRAWMGKAAMITGGVALLVMGALYAPLLLQSTPVAAQPTASQISAPIAQVDSSLDEDQAALAALYEQLSPSVVNIQVIGTAEAAALPDIPGFQLPEGTPGQQTLGEGSGFIFDKDGHIVTNNHVVEGAQKVLVTFSNGMWAEAEVVATDPQADLAVVKVTPPEGFDWRPVNLEEDNSLKVGYHVIAIGNPFGLENTMTTGIVSALGRSFPVGSFGSNRYSLPDVIQTDAAINPGNSGGPLFDLAGNMVGVNFAIESNSRQNSGVGFSIPVSIVKRVVPELIKDGKFDYAYLGLQGNTITADLADAIDLKDNQLGVYVSAVIPGGPAEKGGVKGGDDTVTVDGGLEFQKGGDIITAIDDQPVRRFEDLISYLITKAAPGQTVSLKVIRDGAEQSIAVELGARPTQAPLTTATPDLGQPDNNQPDNNQPGDKPSENQSSKLNARAAIAIAEDAAKEQGLTGDITEKVATPEDRDGKSVWVVELTTADQTATVVVDGSNGDVIDVSIK